MAQLNLFIDSCLKCYGFPLFLLLDEYSLYESNCKVVRLLVNPG